MPRAKTTTTKKRTPKKAVRKAEIAEAGSPQEELNASNRCANLNCKKTLPEGFVVKRQTTPPVTDEKIAKDIRYCSPACAT